MSRHHDKWYTRIFSDPRVVEDLLRSFVHESFVDGLDFTSLKKLNVKFVPSSESLRRADLIYEVKSGGQSAYIYLFLEFQSTVDRFMALRMARYTFEFYEEVQRLTGAKYLNPGLPILIYNGSDRWTAPTTFRGLLHPSEIPSRYLPQFPYFKIAINEIPKRVLVKIRNAVGAIFYVENCTPEDIVRNRKELVSLLSAVFRKEGGQIVRAIIDRIHRTRRLSHISPIIKDVEDIMEVSSMWETAVKEHDKKVYAKGIEKGVEKGIEKGIEKEAVQTVLRADAAGLSREQIARITNLSPARVTAILSRKRRAGDRVEEKRAGYHPGARKRSGGRSTEARKRARKP